MLGAVWIIGYPFYTNLVHNRLQAKLDRQLATPELEEAYRERRVGEGDSLTRLRIPRLNVDVVVVEGTLPKSLRAGAGHYASTPLPCEQGNMAIAGHRTTYGRPFANVDLLEPGDLILLDTPIGSCTYEVSRNPFVTTPTDLSVIKNTPDATLTLTTCHPRGSARQRLIVKATMTSAESQPS
jgi:sortase A